MKLVSCSSQHMTAKMVQNGFKTYIAVMLIQLFLTEGKLYASSDQKYFYRKYNDKTCTKILGAYEATMGKCAKLCALNPQCEGFNVGPLNAGRNVVKNCNLTKPIAGKKTDFEDRAGFGYYERRSCKLKLKGTMPCPRGFICCPDTKPQICPPNTRGENCSKTCTSHVLYHQDLSYGRDLEKLSGINSVLECWEKCWANKMCLSFTHVPFYPACYLKNINDVTSPGKLTSPSPFDADLHVFDCRPYDKAVPYI